MAENDKPPFGYCAYKKGGRSGFTSFWQTRDIEALKKWGEGSVDNQSAEQSADTESETQTDAEKFIEILDRIVEAHASQSNLVAVSGAARDIFPASIALVELLDPIKKSCQLVEESEVYTLYEMTERQFREAAKATRKLDRLHAGVDALPGAILMSVIASFESILSDSLRIILRKNVHRYTSGDKTIKVSDVLSMTSLEDVVDKIISDELYKFFRGSHADQVKFIDSNLGLGIKDSWKRYADFIEIFERRNLVAHGESKFTERYASICAANGHKGSEKLVGNDIELRPSYLLQSMDVLSEFNILLNFNFWRKVDHETSEKIFSKLNHVSYELISEGRPALAYRLLDFALSLKNAQVTDEVRTMMVVNSASACSAMDDQERCNKILDAVDWSAKSLKFRISVAALRNDENEVCALLRPSAAAGEIKPEDIRDWPVFAKVRKHARVHAYYKEVFGFDLDVDTPVDEVSADDSDLSTEASQFDGGSESNADNTVH